MRKVADGICMPITLIVVLAQAHCIAQEFQNRFNPRLLYERDVERAPQGIKSMFRDTFAARRHRAGILNRPGTELLLNDPANSRIIVVDTKTLAETSIPLVSPAIDVQIESQTDMVFVDTYPPGREGDAIHSCYENLEALRNRKSMWSLDGTPLGLHHFHQMRWLNECQRFVVFGNSAHGETKLSLLDRTGIMLASYEMKGCVIGVDETERGFSIFYLTKSGNTQQLTLTRLDDRFKEVKTQKLPLVDRVQFPPSGLFSGVTQGFRLRGLKRAM